MTQNDRRNSQTAQPSVVCYEVLGFQPETLSFLRDHCRLTVLPDPDSDKDGVLSDADAVFAPMGFRFDAARLGRCPRLKAIGSPTTGVPHIDLAYAEAHGIKVFSLSDQQPFLDRITPTAELAWALIVAVTRHLIPASMSVRLGQWEPKRWGAMTPRMLSSMELGIVGFGRLGKHVARYAAAFGMKVGYYDPYVHAAEQRRYPTLETLAAASDVVTIHAKATPEECPLIGQEFFSAMPKGSFFVNTARGTLVDEIALLDALMTGRLAGAALDTLDREHLPEFTHNLEAHPLIQYAREHDNLVLTPHYGGATVDAWLMTERQVADRVVDFLAAAS